MSLLKELEKELLDFEKNLIEKDSLDWLSRIGKEARERIAREKRMKKK